MEVPDSRQSVPRCITPQIDWVKVMVSDTSPLFMLKWTGAQSMVWCLNVGYGNMCNALWVCMIQTPAVTVKQSWI